MSIADLFEDLPDEWPAPDIAPLERFVAPPHLDGSAGFHRCRGRCEIDVNDDHKAIEWWVMRTSNSAVSTRTRRSAAEKLLNWACFERGKAVSSLDEEDFAAFARFLAQPEPLHRWVGMRQQRKSAAWRPFSRPLTGTSLATVLKEIAALVRWLSSQNYADLRFLYGKTAMDDGFATVAVRGAERAVKPHEPLTAPEWQWIQRALERHFPAEDLAPQRFIIELMYYGNLLAEEVTRLELRNFEPPSRAAPCWSISVPKRAAWRGGLWVCTAPPLSDTVGRWMAQREQPREGYMTFRIRGSPDRLLELDSGQVARHGRQVIHMAASLALEHGDVQVGMRLRDRSMVSLRGAFEAHERQREVDHGAIELTGRSHKFGLNMRQRVPEHRDWRHMMHLWTERQNREFRDGGEPFCDASPDKAARGGR
jgi:hypothetical protein